MNTTVKKQRRQAPKRNIADVYMMQDMMMMTPHITRDHIRDMLALPKKKEGEKGLFEHLTHNK